MLTTEATHEENTNFHSSTEKVINLIYGKNKVFIFVVKELFLLSNNL